MSTITPTFGTPVLGQTEKALNAILRRQLAGTGLTEPQWVTLTLALAGGGTADLDALIDRVAGVLKVSAAQAAVEVTDLATADLVQAADGDGSPVEVTDAGRELHARIRRDVTEITQRLWGDLPPEDLAAAGRVLTTILERANAELAGR